VILVDTNVVSELRKARAGKADLNVVAWSRSVRPRDLYLSVVTLQEIETGVLLRERADPRQGVVLRRWLEARVLRGFAGRILPVTIPIARRCAALHVPDPRPVRDALIAATALVHGLTVVTRNAKDFAPTGVPTIDPWQKLGAR
jgi:predicted nucleic acid-binding protein